MDYGFVARPDGDTYSSFAYPGSVCLLPNDRLFTVFTAYRMNAPKEAVGVYSADHGKSWSQPETVFGGTALSDTSSDLAESYADPSLVIVDEKRVILFCVSLRHIEDQQDLSRTRFWRRISEDGGLTFGPVEEMPRHKKYYVGMVHPGLRLQNGTLVMGYSWDKPAEISVPAQGEGEMDLHSGALISNDEGITWAAGQDVHVEAQKGADQLSYATSGIAEPSLVELPDGKLFLLGRTGTRHLWQSFSCDGGLTWEKPGASPLESHNCPAALLRLKTTGAILCVYNEHPKLRARLSAVISTDG